jgi:hypothetical protein
MEKGTKEVSPNKSNRNLQEVASSLLNPEMYDLLPKSKNTKEHLGHVIIEKESHETKAESSKDKRPNISTTKVDTMSRSELLKLSASIEVDGSDLRQIYETKLIGENGLRRLVKEYLGGGDLKKVLREEILEREMDFERDPDLRDMAIPKGGSSAPASSSRTSSFDELIKKAEESISVSNEEAAFYKAKADFEIKQINNQHSRSKKIDYIMSVSIGLLIVAVIIIFITRG